MSGTTPDALTLARVLAAEFVNEAIAVFDDMDAIGQVAEQVDPTIVAEQAALMVEIETAAGPVVAAKVAAFMGRLAAQSQDGGYFFGLAVGQLVRLPALAPQRGDRL
jgi:hypothetical protein